MTPLIKDIREERGTLHVTLTAYDTLRESNKSALISHGTFAKLLSQCCQPENGRNPRTDDMTYIIQDFEHAKSFLGLLSAAATAKDRIGLLHELLPEGTEVLDIHSMEASLREKAHPDNSVKLVQTESMLHFTMPNALLERLLLNSECRVCRELFEYAHNYNEDVHKQLGTYEMLTDNFEAAYQQSAPLRNFMTRYAAGNVAPGYFQKLDDKFGFTDAAVGPEPLSDASVNEVDNLGHSPTSSTGV